MWPNPQETADLVTFTEEILNEKLYFLCSVTCKNGVSTILFNITARGAAVTEGNFPNSQLDSWNQLMLELVTMTAIAHISPGVVFVRCFYVWYLLVFIFVIYYGDTEE